MVSNMITKSLSVLSIVILLTLALTTPSKSYVLSSEDIDMLKKRFEDISSTLNVNKSAKYSSSIERKLSMKEINIKNKVSSDKNRHYIYVYINPKYFNKNFSKKIKDFSNEISRLGIEVVDDRCNPIVVCIYSLSELYILSNLTFVSYIADAEKKDIKPLEVVSEGVNVISAPDAWWDLGFDGAGVKVGVLDLGFEDWSELVDERELPVDTHFYEPNGVGDGVHGSACAEIVHDTAPGAKIFLSTTGDTTYDLYSAVKWFIENGVRIISHSVGWWKWCPAQLDSDGDGVGEFWDIYKVVQYALDNGVVWVNAAGNERDKGHWMGFWRDNDGDGILDIYGVAMDPNKIELDREGIQVVLKGGETFKIRVRWSDYPYPDHGPTNDFDLYLVCSDNITISSDDPQTGNFGQEPYESISFTPPGTDEYICSVFIKAYNVSNTTQFFNIFWEGHEDYWYYHDSSYDPFIEEGTICSPADHPDVITVGAVPWYAHKKLEPFSSIGPVYNPYVGAYDLIKPDVVAPDDVSTVSYSKSFPGTSAATPHVAGVAALILSANPNLSPRDVKEIIEMTALDLGEDGKDIYFGSGLVDAYSATYYAMSLTPKLCTNPDELHFNLTLKSGDTASINISIINCGYGQLVWGMNSDQPWVSIYPESGILNENESINVTLKISAENLKPGMYQAYLNLISNDVNKIGLINLTVLPAVEVSIRMPNKVAPNVTFNAAIEICNVRDLSSFRINVYFNNSVLAVSDVERGEVLNSWSFFNFSIFKGRLIIVADKISGNSINTSNCVKLLKIKFTVVGDVGEVTSVNLSGILLNSNLNEIYAVWNGNYVQVELVPYMVFSNLTVKPTFGMAPLNIVVSVNVTNAGYSLGIYNATLVINSSVVAFQVGTLDVNETTTITFHYVLEELGTYLITVDDLEPVVVKVVDLINYYAGEDGKISGLELLLAIQDWRNNKITGLQLLQVIQAWRTS